MVPGRGLPRDERLVLHTSGYQWPHLDIRKKKHFRYSNQVKSTVSYETIVDIQFNHFWWWMQIHHRLIRDIGRPKPRRRGVSTCSASTSLPTSTRCETSLRSMLGAVLGENTQQSTANVWILMVAWVGYLPLAFICFDFLWGDIMWHGNMWILYPSLYLAIGNLHRNWTPWLTSKDRGETNHQTIPLFSAGAVPFATSQSQAWDSGCFVQLEIR